MTNSVPEQKSFLLTTRQSLRGRTALVVSCGPSLQRWRDIYNILNDNDPYVVCIKQSINEVRNLCDLHVINVFNIQRYQYDKRKPLIVLGTVPDAPPIFCPHDQQYVVRVDGRNPLGMRATLASELNFEDYELGSTGMENRPWGPGIMYEFVFPYLVWCGVSKIVTIGWDIANQSGKNQHFYDPPIKHDGIGYKTLQRLNRTAYIILRKWRLTLAILNLFAHLLGKRYNPAHMQPGEAEITGSSLPKLQSWLASHGVELEVYSDSDWMTKVLAKMEPHSPTNTSPTENE